LGSLLSIPQQIELPDYNLMFLVHRRNEQLNFVVEIDQNLQQDQKIVDPYTFSMSSRFLGHMSLYHIPNIILPTLNYI
jgi:hypothetical protein